MPTDKQPFIKYLLFLLKQNSSIAYCIHTSSSQSIIPGTGGNIIPARNYFYEIKLITASLYKLLNEQDGDNKDFINNW